MSKSWRDFLPIHPACAMFDSLAPDELRALGEDITKNPLTSPIVLWGAGFTSQPCLIGGRNRLEEFETTERQLRVEFAGVTSSELWANPDAYVVSANIRRRQVSINDNDRLIAQLLRVDRTKSNRTVAKLTDTSHPHVVKVREQAPASDERSDIQNFSQRDFDKGGGA
jgi:hypothetical protein